jgi:uncharacterized membrane protein YedE/YeeE
MMESFTPAASLLGGVLIGLAASGLLWLDGKLAGISGIVGGMLHPERGDVGWRAAFVAGLLAGGMILRIALPAAFTISVREPLPLLLAAGLLVGFGTRLGNGCTSGHGVCGISRGSPRSLVATATFMATGVLTVLLVRHVLGVSP